MYEIKADTGGTVIDIKVAEGERITSGGTLAMLESMKIEIPVTAPVSGIVVEVRAQLGLAIEEGDVLMVVDPSTIGS